MKKETKEDVRMAEIKAAKDISELRLTLELARDVVIKSLRDDVIILDKRFIDECQRLNGECLRFKLQGEAAVKREGARAQAELTAALVLKFPKLKRRIEAVAKKVAQSLVK